MKVHFIAIGGSAMHNLAIALHQKGIKVTGSDDEIFEPARNRLATSGLLPATEGWFPEKIDNSLDAVILGMHAKPDNPELLKAREIGCKIFSYPEYLYEQSKNKKRIVIGGSHGKTTITAMILHVLHHYNVACDYMVGAQLEGFDVMVKLTEDAPFMIIEGDEYLTSPLDRRPKFHLYKPDIALLSGIAWDHINVFPTFENYLDQFRVFIETITEKGSLVYCSEDKWVNELCRDSGRDITLLPYGLPDHTIINNTTFLTENGSSNPLMVFGRHNLLNISGARIVCAQLGINSEAFNQAIQTFRGASKRLEMVGSNEFGTIYKDFAHAPSKVEATLRAVRQQFSEKKIVACLELHTYSSLNKEFLPHYKGALDNADIALVYYNLHALQIKRLPDLEPGVIANSFGNPRLEVFNDSDKLKERLLRENGKDTIYLMMSSGNYDGIDPVTLISHS